MRTWIVIDTKTGAKVAGPFKSKTRAHRKADKLDLEYGAICYAVREVPQLSLIEDENQ